MKHILIFLFSIFFFTCANQGFPPGGPVDKTPPLIRSTFPAMDSTNVPLNAKIEFEFSETIDRNSVENVIFITPYPGENVAYKWRGNRLQIKVPGGLLPDRTYVITIGAGARDRRSNAMKESFSLAFSTGAELDKGGIGGNVYAEGETSVLGTQIWAYDLQTTPEPDPVTVNPIYVTQVSENGAYKLQYLALSAYRLFAVLDKDLDKLYDPGYDLVGVTHQDISLTADSSTAAIVNFMIALRDTIPPFLTAVQAPDRRHLDLRFSEPLQEQFLADSSNYTIEGNGDSLKILFAYRDSRNSSYVHLVTGEQEENKNYIVEAKNFLDQHGFKSLADSNRLEFKGSARPDTVKPTLVSTKPPDSAKLVLLDTEVELLFSEYMDKQSAEHHFALEDSSGNKVQGTFHWKNGDLLQFQPEARLIPEMKYTISVPVDSVFDYFNNSLADTLIKKWFVTVNPDTLSEISGRMSDMKTGAKGLFFIRAKSLKKEHYETWAEDDGRYFFKNVLPGIYLLELYRDEDMNKKYSLGEVSPFAPAERYYVYPDSINIRANWPNEGNDIQFPH